MTRLYSISAFYIAVFVIPIIGLGQIICIWTLPQKIWFLDLMPVILFTLWGLGVKHWKKVYYENGALYIYNKFSSDAIIVRKEDIGSFDKRKWYQSSLYKILYYDSNNDSHIVYFQRNMFLNNLDDIIDELTQ